MEAKKKRDGIRKRNGNKIGITVIIREERQYRKRKRRNKENLENTRNKGEERRKEKYNYKGSRVG